MIKIWLDEGHNYGDHGACHNGLFEDRLTLALGRHIADNLRAHPGDFKVATTVEEWMGQLALQLIERPRRAKKWGADLFVSLHFNAVENKEAKGSEVFYASPESYPIAETILRHLPVPRRGVKWAGGDLPNTPEKEPRFAVLDEARLLGIPAVLVEPGFISHKPFAEWVGNGGGIVDLSFGLTLAIRFVALELEKIKETT